MAQPQRHPLRALSEQEERELQRIVKATSERQDVIWYWQSRQNTPLHRLLMRPI